MNSLKIIIDQASIKLRGEKALAEYLGVTQKILTGVIAGERELPPAAQEKLEKMMNLDHGSLSTTSALSQEKIQNTPHSSTRQKAPSF